MFTSEAIILPVTKRFAEQLITCHSQFPNSNFNKFAKPSTTGPHAKFQSDLTAEVD